MRDAYQFIRSGRNGPGKFEDYDSLVPVKDKFQDNQMCLVYLPGKEDIFCEDVFFISIDKLNDIEELSYRTEMKELESKKDKPDISILGMFIDEMELSVRSNSCLQAAGIKTISDLITKTELEMLEYKNFARKSLSELVEKLGVMGLSFGMDVDEFWTQPAVEKIKLTVEVRKNKRGKGI